MANQAVAARAEGGTMLEFEIYYCPICYRNHRIKSKIGKIHKWVATSPRLNPGLLAQVGSAAVTGVGLGLGFGAANWATGKIRGKNPVSKYAERWTGSLTDLVRKVSYSDARYSGMDTRTGAVIFLDPNDLSIILIEHGDNMYEAYSNKDAVRILDNIRKGKKFPDTNPWGV